MRIIRKTEWRRTIQKNSVTFGWFSPLCLLHDKEKFKMRTFSCFTTSFFDIDKDGTYGLLYLRDSNQQVEIKR